MEEEERARDPITFKKGKANPNIKTLFHGSGPIGIRGIKCSGFDSRYFKPTGMYGRGAYFADNPCQSHGYTQADPDNNNCRQMFIVKVALGKQEVLTAAANNKLGPSPGYHSILGKAGKNN